jgi:hypothetical protein
MLHHQPLQQRRSFQLRDHGDWTAAQMGKSRRTARVLRPPDPTRLIRLTRHTKSLILQDVRHPGGSSFEGHRRDRCAEPVPSIDVSTVDTQKQKAETLAAGAICLRGDISSIVPQPEDNERAATLFPASVRRLWKKCTRKGLAPQRGNWGADRAVSSAGPWVRGGGTGARALSCQIPGVGVLGSNNGSNSGECALVPIERRITPFAPRPLFPA